jgi:hypothetical protein
MFLNTAVAKAVRRIRAVSLLIARSRPVLTVSAKVPYVLAGQLSVKSFCHGITSKSITMCRFRTVEITHGSSGSDFGYVAGEGNQAARYNGFYVNQPLSCSHVLAIWPMIKLVKPGGNTPRGRRCQQHDSLQVARPAWSKSRDVVGSGDDFGFGTRFFCHSREAEVP